MTKKAFARAIKLCGGQHALARAIGGKITQSHVSHWIKVGKVPAEHCRQIEAATGGKVTRYQLRPDVFGRRPDRISVAP